MKKSILASDTTVSPPPPPPPSPSKGSRKTLMAAIIIVIIVVAAVVGAYLLTRSGSPSNNPTPAPGTTPTPAPGTTASPGATVSPGATASPGSGTPSPSQTNPYTGATSIQFSVSYTTGGQTSYAYTYSAKNIGTPNMMMRIEGTFSSESMIYIINGAQQKLWINSGGEWIDMSTEFSTQWDSWNQTWQGYETSLAEWAGTGEYTYTYPGSGDTLRIYNIAVNPELADSMFQH
jgi:hypothetical protein